MFRDITRIPFLVDILYLLRFGVLFSFLRLATVSGIVISIEINKNRKNKEEKLTRNKKIDWSSKRSVHLGKHIADLKKKYGSSLTAHLYMSHSA